MKFKTITSFLIAGTILLSQSVGAPSVLAADSEITVPLGTTVVLSDGAYSVNDTNYNKHTEEMYQEDKENLTNDVSSYYSNADNRYNPYDAMGGSSADFSGGSGDDAVLDAILQQMWGVSIGDYDSLASMLPTSSGEHRYDLTMSMDEFNNLIGQQNAAMQDKYNTASDDAQKKAQEGTKDAAEEIAERARQIINGIDPDTGEAYDDYIGDHTPDYDPDEFIQEHLPEIEQAIKDAMDGVDQPFSDTSNFDAALDDIKKNYNAALEAKNEMSTWDDDVFSIPNSLTVFPNMISLFDSKDDDMNVRIDVNNYNYANNYNTINTIGGTVNPTLVTEYPDTPMSFSYYINDNPVYITNANGEEEALTTYSASASGYVIDDTMNTLCEDNMTWWQEFGQNFGFSNGTTFALFDEDGNARLGTITGSIVTCECGKTMTQNNASTFYLSNKNQYYCADCAQKHLNGGDVILGENNQFNSDGSENKNYNGDKWADGDDTYIVKFLNISYAGEQSDDYYSNPSMEDFYKSIKDATGLSQSQVEELFPPDQSLPDDFDSVIDILNQSMGDATNHDYNDDLDDIWSKLSDYLSPYGLEGFDNPEQWSDEEKAKLAKGLDDYLNTGKVSDDLLAVLGDKTTLTSDDFDSAGKAATSKSNYNAEAEQKIKDTGEYDEAAKKVFGEWPSNRDLWTPEMNALYDDWMNQYNANNGDNDFRRTLDEMNNEGYFDNASGYELLDGMNAYLNNMNDFTSLNDSVQITVLVNVSDDLNVIESGTYYKDSSVKAVVTNEKTNSVVYSTSSSASSMITWRTSAVGTFDSKTTLTTCPINYSIGTYNTSITCYYMTPDGKQEYLVSNKQISRVRTDEDSMSDVVQAGKAKEFDLGTLVIHVEEMNLDVDRSDFYDTERVY